MKNMKKIERMFTMQQKLNKQILNEFGKDSITEDKLQMAIFDELGELTHELKGDWCWWKKSQKPVDRQRVLEELVDVYHFVMTYELIYGICESINEIINFYSFDIMNFDDPIDPIPSKMHDALVNVSSWDCKLNNLLILTKTLGFNIDEVYQEYINKNKINYERLENGY